MKRTYLITGLTLLSLAAGSGVALAHGMKGERGGMGGMGGGMPMIQFEEADADGDGKVTREEAAAHARAKFDAADTDGNGRLSDAEIRAAVEKRAEEARQRRFERMATRMIERMDSDGDGEVSFDEMPGQRSMQDRMFDRLDSDGDGAVSDAEMRAARDKMQERRGERGMQRGDGKSYGGHGKMHGHGDRQRN